ncbi:MAG: hypothetical protein ABIR91_03420 [Candidatus Saccharimonadales bacterium]
MAFGGDSGSGGGGAIASSTDVALNAVANDQVLTYSTGSSKWTNKTPTGGSGGVPATYALGRVKYSAGWPSTRPTGYAYIDWIKSSASDPDPSAGVMIAGDTISEWQ